MGIIYIRVPALGRINRATGDEPHDNHSLFSQSMFYLRNMPWKPECVLSFNMGW